MEPPGPHLGAIWQPLDPILDTLLGAFPANLHYGQVFSLQPGAGGAPRSVYNMGKIKNNGQVGKNTG